MVCVLWLVWVVLGWWRSWIGDLDGLFDGVLVVFLWLVLRGVRWGVGWVNLDFAVVIWVWFLF